MLSHPISGIAIAVSAVVGIVVVAQIIRLARSKDSRPSAIAVTVFAVLFAISGAGFAEFVVLFNGNNTPFEALAGSIAGFAWGGALGLALTRAFRNRKAAKPSFADQPSNGPLQLSGVNASRAILLAFAAIFAILSLPGALSLLFTLATLRSNNGLGWSALPIVVGIFAAGVPAAIAVGFWKLGKRAA